MDSKVKIKYMIVMLISLCIIGKIIQQVATKMLLMLRD